MGEREVKYKRGRGKIWEVEEGGKLESGRMAEIIVEEKMSKAL